jgi:Flp pilus assembly pilin Flp
MPPRGPTKGPRGSRLDPVGSEARGWKVAYERLILALTRARTWLRGRADHAHDANGATAVEYAIMLAFIAAIVVAGVALLGQGTVAGFEKVKFP